MRGVLGITVGAALLLVGVGEPALASPKAEEKAEVTGTATAGDMFDAIDGDNIDEVVSSLSGICKANWDMHRIGEKDWLETFLRRPGIGPDERKLIIYTCLAWQRGVTQGLKDAQAIVDKYTPGPRAERR